MNTTYHGVSASCCGKVLVSGGYLVLERAHRGLVIAVDARFTCRVASITDADHEKSQHIIAQNHAADDIVAAVYVYAPQRSSIVSSYTVIIDRADVVRIERGVGEANPFVELSVAYTTQFAASRVSRQTVRQRLARPLLIECRADNTFYTAEPTTATTVATTKTGLGSSAALVSAVVSALLQHFDSSSSHTATAHNIAQFVHSAAQGKIGSGFDVAAAFFGSQIYRRSDAKYAQTVLNKHASLNHSDTARITVERDLIIPLITPSADAKETDRLPVITPISLPPMITMLVADVRGGTSTPSMVRNVRKWKESTEFDIALWTAFADDNERIIETFCALSRLSRSSARYQQSIRRCARTSTAEDDHIDSDVVSAVELLSSAHRNMRRSLRSIGAASGADIEPPTQTALCDETLGLPGVFMCGVPGAGGNDAVFAIVIDQADVISAVESLWRKHNNVRRLMVHPVHDGIVVSTSINFTSVSPPPSMTVSSSL